MRVDVPKRLNDRQKELLRQFENSLSGKEYETRKSFFDRMKEYFTDKEKEKEKEKEKK